MAVAAGVLVANKVDLRARASVPPAVADAWAQGNGLQFFETSAVRPLAALLLNSHC